MWIIHVMQMPLNLFTEEKCLLPMCNSLKNNLSGLHIDSTLFFSNLVARSECLVCYAHPGKKKLYLYVYKNSKVMDMFIADIIII